MLMLIDYTNTTCTESVETIMAFKKRGYSYDLYEVPQFAPGGIKLCDKIHCRFTRLISHLIV